MSYAIWASKKPIDDLANFFSRNPFSWLSKAKQRYDDLTFCTVGDLCLGQKPPIDSQGVHSGAKSNL